MRKVERPDEIRKELAKLRERLEAGGIDASTHAHLSARLLHELKTLQSDKPRYAKS